MAQTQQVTLHIPRAAHRELQGVVADLPADEFRELELGDAPHGKTEEYIYREYIMSRRNLAEELTGTTEVEVTGTGEIVASEESGGLFG